MTDRCNQPGAARAFPGQGGDRPCHLLVWTPMIAWEANKLSEDLPRAETCLPGLKKRDEVEWRNFQGRATASAAGGAAADLTGMEDSGSGLEDEAATNLPQGQSMELKGTLLEPQNLMSFEHAWGPCIYSLSYNHPTATPPHCQAPFLAYSPQLQRIPSQAQLYPCLTCA